MPISSILTNFLLFAAVGWFARKSSKFTTVFASILKLSVLLSLVWLVVTALGYLVTPLFFDHAEVNIANVAAYWSWGQQSVYTLLDDPHRYSLLYGPNSYIFSAFFQSLGGENVLLFSKLPGVLALVVSLLSASYLACSIQTSVLNRMLLTASAALIFCGFYNYSYWIRPDSFLVCAAMIGLVVAKKARSSWSAYLGLAFLMGLSVGFKLHGAVYILPFAALYLERTREKISFIKILAAAFLAGAVAYAPFALPGISLGNYLDWLKMASKHSLQFSEFLRNFTFTGAFLILFWILGFARHYKYTFVLFFISGFLASVVGSKVGAGTNHLMPLLVPMFFLSVEQYRRLSKDDQKRLGFVLGAFVMTLVLNGINRQKRVKELFLETSQRIAEYEDFKVLSKKYDGAMELGYSSLDSYLSANYKPWLIKERGVLLLDGASLMDLGASNVQIPAATVELIKSCEIRLFILPVKGEAWSLKSFYEGQELFSDDFRNAFARYKEVERSEHYRVFECR